MFKVNDLINEQYEVRGWAEGGMGRVYFVFDQVTHNHLVIKMIKADLKESKEACSRFEREAEAWINLKDHKHIVRAMSFHRVPMPFLLEEFIDGPSLHQLIRKEPAGLSIHQAVEFGIHIAAGLQHAHTQQMPKGTVGIVHRDLKPHNVLISRQCVAKIADFGLAKVVGESSPGSGHAAVGTVHYMSPEHLKGKAKQRADLYSLGVTIYEMLTARLPFTGRTWSEVAHQIEKNAPVPLSTLRPDVPARLQDFIYACLQKKPTQRPSGALAALRELEAIRTLLPRENAPPCASCGYLPRFGVEQCPVCGPPLTFPNAEDVAPSRGEPAAPTAWLCRCGENLAMEYAFCLYCGLPQSQERACGNCAAINPAEFSFCSQCGSKFE
jgi:serine/threonine-protein kinase